MASGDRIELLTASTFETAMSTVAQEDSVSNVKTVADTINTNVAANKTTLSTVNTNASTIKTSVGTASTAPSVTSAGGIVNTANTVQQKLQGISQYQIGATNSTGGSATAGNVMAKLNAILTNLNSLTSSAGSGLASTLFVPSDTVLKSFIGNTPATLQGYYCIGGFAAKYTGTLKVKVTFRCSTEPQSSHGSKLFAYINPSGYSSNMYPSIPLQKMTSEFSDTSLYFYNSLFSGTLKTTEIYPRVKAGDMMYIVIVGNDANPCIVTSCDVCGSTIVSY